MQIDELQSKESEDHGTIYDSRQKHTNIAMKEQN